MEKYPNLKELVIYHPYHITTFADFADVEVDLFEAALVGSEKLTDEEIRQIAKYTEIPFGVLRCSRLIMLDKANHKHREMVHKLGLMIYAIWDAEKAGSRHAELFINGYGKTELVNLELAFQDGRCTYARYLAIKELVNQTISFIEGEKHKKRARKTA